MALTSSTSMIIDGIAASEAIDSSGEILDVDGCDISDFENGVGLLNYEHRGDDAVGASGNDIVGKIIYAKKIKKKDDCEDKRQEAYWDHVKLPFVYIKGRLYDGSDHPGAKALAAAIRDAVTHKEPILARFSIEGSTLKKEGQRLARTIAKKVAITFKPANKSAISGLVSDPKSNITEKAAEKSLLSRLLDEETIKSERPGEQKLGSHEMEYANLEVVTDPAALLKMTAQNLRTLLKTMTAGQGGGAPSTLTGGAALQREDDRLHRHKLKNDLRAAVRDMPDSARISKEEMRKFFKFKLPEVNDTFLDHFTDLVDDIRARKVDVAANKAWDAVKKNEGEEAPKPPETGLPKIEYTPRPESADPAVVSQPRKTSVGLSGSGELLSNKLGQQNRKVKLYDYGSDPQFLEVIHADDASKSPSLTAEQRAQIVKYVHTPWKRAAKSWLVLNKLAQTGDLPASVIAHAAIFSAMSPNTSVPIQELYFGHYQDFKEKHGPIFENPMGVTPQDAEHFHRWLNKTTPPEFFKEFYLQNTQNKGGISFDVAREKTGTYKPGATMAARPQGRPLLNYHRFHPFMQALVKEVKDDGRAFTDYIMQKKHEGGASAMMEGYGPKLARYMALMMGQGNVVVPDRHFLRALFNLPENDPVADYVFNALTPVEGERILRGIDYHFHRTAPGVQKALDMWPQHFENREMQANGLGFWLQWLAMPHYNSLRGIAHDNLNIGTAHDPYFKAVRKALDDEGIPHDMVDPSGLYKAEERQFGAPMAARVATATKRLEEEFGEAAATFFFHSFGVPALLHHERISASNDAAVRKMEAVAIEMSVLAKNLGEQPPAQPAPVQWPPVEAPEVNFKGQRVLPGFATIYATPKGEHAPEGRKMAIIGKAPPSADSPAGDWVMVPHEKLGAHQPEDMERWGLDSTAEIHSPPIFPDLDRKKVHKDFHVPDHYAPHSFQKEMVHGLDMSKREDNPDHFRGGVTSGSWRMLPNGNMAYVKPHYDGSPTGMPSQPHAEVLYHNIMHHLGLGEHVAPSALFHHPDLRSEFTPGNIDWYSVHQAVENADHYNSSDWHHADLLGGLMKSGRLEKLAMVNRLLGNRDRHENNFLFGGKDGNSLYMIDHGHTLTGNEKYSPYMPAYLRKGLETRVRRGGQEFEPVHPEARNWLLGIDPAKLSAVLGAHHTPPDVAYSIMNRLKHMQEYAKDEPNASIHEVWNAPDLKAGNDIHDWDEAARHRGIKDPEFDKRRLEMVNAHNIKKEAKYKHEEQAWMAEEDVRSHALEEARRGKDPDPYHVLVGLKGEAEAKRLVLPHDDAPADLDAAIKKYNKRVRTRISDEIANRKHAANSIAYSMARNEKAGMDAWVALAGVKGALLDKAAKGYHAPHRPDGASDQEYLKIIVDYLRPMIDKQRKYLG